MYQIKSILLSNVLTVSEGQAKTPALHRMGVMSIGATTPTIPVDTNLFEQALSELAKLSSPLAQPLAAQLATVR